MLVVNHTATCSLHGGERIHVHVRTAVTDLRPDVLRQASANPENTVTESSWDLEKFNPLLLWGLISLPSDDFPKTLTHFFGTLKGFDAVKDPLGRDVNNIQVRSIQRQKKDGSSQIQYQPGLPVRCGFSKGK